MRVFNILDRNTAVIGNHFLEASAGTGKTFSVEHAICRLLLETELTLDKLLVVTFTRAATRELKQRIYRNLKMLEQMLCKKESTLDYVNAVLERGDEAIRAALVRIQLATCQFEQAQIFTIHGFCYQMLSRFAFEAKVDFELSDPDKQQHEKLLLKKLRDHLQASLGEFCPEQLHLLLRAHRYDEEKLLQEIVRYLPSLEEIEEPRSFDKIFSTFANEIKEIVKNYEIRSEDFVAEYKNLAACYKLMGAKEFLSQAELLGKILAKGFIEEREFRELISSTPFFLSMMREDNKKVRAKWPENLLYPGLFDLLCKTALHLIQEAADPLQMSLRIGCNFMRIWNASGYLKSCFSPDDLLKKMEASLKIPAFLKRVKEVYRAAIIDEFQDTDPVQWQIFCTLFLEDKQDLLAFYLVGDPKQSIYAFRKADLYTYLKAARVLGDQNRALLTTNFRSEPGLIQALNTLFSEEFAGKWLCLKEASIDYTPVLSAPDARDTPFKDGKRSVHFFLASAPAVKRGRNDQIESEKIFPFIIKEILSLEKEEGFSLSSFAVLVKDRYGAQRVCAALKKAKIPFALKQQKPLLESSALVALLQLFEAALNPENESAVKVFSCGELLCSDALFSIEKMKGIKQKLYFLQGIHEKFGVGAFFQETLELFWDEQESLLETLIGREKLSLYQEAVQLIELLTQEQSTYVTLKEQANYLRELKQDSFYYANSYLVKSAQEGDAVQIMTTHLSKGLEFEVVFALGIASAQTVQEKTLHSKSRKKIVKWDLDDAECAEHLENQEAEKIRQLYVALTRAKKRLYIPIMIEEIEEGEKKDLARALHSPLELFFSRSPLCKEPLSLATYRSLLNWLSDRAAFSFEELPTLTFYSRELAQPTLALVKPDVLSLDFFTKQSASYTSLARTTAEVSSRPMIEPALAQALPTIHTMPQGAETGTLLHQIFEKLIATKLLFQRNLIKRKELIEQELAGTPLFLWKEAIFQMVNQIASMPFQSKEGFFTLEELDSTRLLCEMEFLFEEKELIMKGFIDLVFEVGGKFYIVDWKSNYLGPDDKSYSEQSLQQAIVENQYDLQAALYAAALKKHLKGFSDKQFELGGAFYCFLRGRAVLHLYPDLEKLRPYNIEV